MQLADISITFDMSAGCIQATILPPLAFVGERGCIDDRVTPLAANPRRRGRDRDPRVDVELRRAGRPGDVRVGRPRRRGPRPLASSRRARGVPRAL